SCRYRTPPCTNLVLRDEVPFAKSYFSNNTVLYPLEAASTAMPNPVAPPPIMQISHSGLALSWSFMSALCITAELYYSVNSLIDHISAQAIVALTALFHPSSKSFL